ncbi:MAG: acyl-CoA thioesterase [Chitinophagaceae bacterium]|nr:acyl-CoA thioesterase [Chitinophagaceae bacterium]
MYTTETRIRVRYAETDQMGVVYHGNYFAFFEAGRGEFIREFGFSYADMEKQGLLLFIVDVHCKYIRPARYDDLITIRTSLKELPIHHKVEFYSDVLSEQGELLASGKVVLYCMDAANMKRSTLPEPFLEKLRPHFEQTNN